jgi:hypothetical protein
LFPQLRRKGLWQNWIRQEWMEENTIINTNDKNIIFKINLS